MADSKQAKKMKGGGFQSLALSPEVLKGVMQMGYRVPTPVQRKSLPVTLTNVDTVVMARTGSGKTAAFLIPVLEKLKEHSPKVGARAIVLSPSRELALQTLTFARKMGRFTGLRFALLVGGDSMEKQFEALADNPDVVIATPGRLMHHLQEVPDFTLKAVEVVVFDEADRLFEMGFAEQLREVMRTVPERRQTLLFSATMPKQLVQFARAGLQDPVLIRLDTERKVSENLSMAFLTCRSADKPACLLFLLREVIPRDQMTVIFTATRHHAEFLHGLIQEIGLASSIIYGAMDMEARKANLEKFRRGRVQLLLVTDVAARGIDVPLLNNVVNYSFPPLPKLFVHRVGRAARQGRRGAAFSLVEPEELPYMMDLHLFLGRPVSCTYSGSAAAAVNGISNSSGSSSSSTVAVAPAAVAGYDLSEMTPELVHYGGFPQQILDEENESLREIMSRGGGASGLPQMAKVADNGMKQYRRTRPDASKRAIERCKGLERAAVHPLMLRHATRGMVSADGAAQRSAYLKAMTAFRPKETIFEVLGGGGTVFKTDVGRVMGDVRQEMRVRNLLERAQIGGSLLNTAAAAATAAAADSATAAAADAATAAGTDSSSEAESDDELAQEGDSSDEMDSDADEEYMPPAAATAAEDSSGSGRSDSESDSDAEESSSNTQQQQQQQQQQSQAVPLSSAAPTTTTSNSNSLSGSKRKLSKADRKKVKRARARGEDSSAALAKLLSPSARGSSGLDALDEFDDDGMDIGADGHHAGSSDPNNDGGRSVARGRYADPEHFIGYGVSEGTAFVEGAMQPRSVEKASDGFATDRLAEAMMDVNPDEAVAMARKQRVLHWDQKKRKFIKTSLAEMSENKSRKIRNEAGVIVTAKKEKVGVMYNKWQKKSKRSVGREGDEEEGTGSSSKVDRRRGGGGGRGSAGRGESQASSNGPNVRHNAGVRDELRDGRQIKKVREAAENKRLRSMPKAQRAATLKKGKAAYDRKQADKRQLNFQGRTRSRVIIK